METLTKTSVAQIGEDVGLEYGTKLVKDYFDTYPEQAYGHIIGRRIIDKILAQPGCQGLTIYPALNEDGKRTLVYAGIDIEGRPIKGIVADMGTFPPGSGEDGDAGTTSFDW